eukprot:TRINITY_DN5756_c0_g1_i31.p1 TRINITY_DN5756_c0_g1~~TRINITY_DN5756_c0_g1_i31.p1  ORF type:complete len:417 (-),score=105.85 TRINITY_DN5756_c0_g1_i31:228-1478(-)
MGQSASLQLIEAAWEGKLKKVTKAITKQGVQINAQNENDETALIAASLAGHEEVVAFLLEHQANVRLQDIKGETALHKAAVHGFKGIADLLLAAGADISGNKDGKTPLHVAAERGNTMVLWSMINAIIDLASMDKNGSTALHIAAANSATECVALILIHGSDDLVFVTDSEGKTAMEIAKEAGHSECSRLLKLSMDLFGGHQLRETDLRLCEELLGSKKFFVQWWALHSLGTLTSNGAVCSIVCSEMFLRKMMLLLASGQAELVDTAMRVVRNVVANVVEEQLELLQEQIDLELVLSIFLQDPRLNIKERAKFILRKLGKHEGSVASKVLAKGQTMLKVGRNGKPHNREFRLNEQLSQIEWTSEKLTKSSSDTVVRLDEVSELLEGQQSSLFEKKQKNIPDGTETQSFSLVYDSRE